MSVTLSNETDMRLGKRGVFCDYEATAPNGVVVWGTIELENGVIMLSMFRRDNRTGGGRNVPLSHFVALWRAVADSFASKRGLVVTGGQDGEFKTRALETVADSCATLDDKAAYFTGTHEGARFVMTFPTVPFAPTPYCNLESGRAEIWRAILARFHCHELADLFAMIQKARNESRRTIDSARPDHVANVGQALRHFAYAGADSAFREWLISEGLRRVARLYGFTWRNDSALHIDSLGEISLAVKSPDPIEERAGICGQFGPDFAGFMNKNRIPYRTGVAPCVGHVLPENGWFRLNHFDAIHLIAKAIP